jgi:hypothetical protein
MAYRVDGRTTASMTEGQREALDALYREHTPTVARLARVLTDTPQDADDVAAETWARVAEQVARHDGLREGGRDVRRWLSGECGHAYAWHCAHAVAQLNAARDLHAELHVRDDVPAVPAPRGGGQR